jgi:N utilization substance protein B
MSRKRSQARHHAVQALYQWQMTGDDVAGIVNQFLIEYRDSEFDAGYFRELMTGVTGNLERLDQALGPYLDRVINSVDPVERAILRLGAFELADKPEIPYRVVINEAVELAKVFGAEQGHRYINGVLDKLAQQLRAIEIKASGRA